MAKHYVTIELNEKELADLVGEKYGLKNPRVSIEKYDGGLKDTSYTRIVVTSEVDLVDLEKKFREKHS